MASVTRKGRKYPCCTQENLQYLGASRKLFGYDQIQCQCIVIEGTIQTYPAVECHSEVREKCYEWRNVTFFLSLELFLELVCSSLVG